MRKWLSENKVIIFILIFLLVWRIFLFIPEYIGNNFISQHPGYIGIIPWANLDGIHYLSIAEKGYAQYEQAFFPLFPLLIKLISQIFRIDYLYSALTVVYLSLFSAVLMFFKLLRLDYKISNAYLGILFLILFPTSFFLTSIYTESLFLALLFGSFYAARKKRWLYAGILGSLAASTRLVGILILPALIVEYILQNKDKKNINLPNIKEFLRSAGGILIIPSGLLFYMIYLKITTNDFINFIHSQPAFGAGRSGGEIILLPQVIWRYFKIFTTVSLTNYDYWIALLEIITFFLVILIIYVSYKNRIRLSYVVFSLLSVLIPTLSGTFSSIPRYALSSFVIFIFFATIKNNRRRYAYLVFSIVLQVLLTALFLRGYFVS